MPSTILRLSVDVFCLNCYCYYVAVVVYHVVVVYYIVVVYFRHIKMLTFSSV